MSREVVSNGHYTLAFGVDHAIGTFFTIHDRYLPEPDNEEDPDPDPSGTPLVQYSSMYGLSWSVNMASLDNVDLGRVLSDIANAYQCDKGMVNLTENDVIRVGRALGLYTLQFCRRVYELWD